MASIVEVVREIVRDELRSVRTSELGVVEAVYPHSSASDKDNYGCDVRLKNSGLVLKRAPISTDRIGTVGAPNVGDLVLLAFPRGDINQPIVIGRLYNEEDRPPVSRTDEVIFRLPLDASDDKTVKTSVKNHQDENPAREMLVEMAPKIVVRLSDDAVKATAGQTEMFLNQPGAGGGSVTCQAGGTKITMNQDGDLTVEALGSMTLKAAGNLDIEATNVSIKANAKATFEGAAQAIVKGGAVAELSSGASTTVQGGIVSVKGVTSFSP